MSREECRAEVAYLADQLERAFRGGAWHGPAVLEVLEGVDAAGAVRRPVSARHCIWEIVGHTAHWIDVADRRIRGEAVRELPEEADWPSTEDGREELWSRLLASLDGAHCRLQATLRGLSDAQLDDPAGSDPTVRGLLFGLLQHNVYHAGQIALLRASKDGP